MRAGRPRCRRRSLPTRWWSKAKRASEETMATNDTLVGFIGLGTMGGKMAANLQKAGFKLVVHDLTRQAASHHLNAGAVWADSPRKVAEQCDVLFTSLPEPTDVEAVSAGDAGLLAGIRK